MPTYKFKAGEKPVISIPIPEEIKQSRRGAITDDEKQEYLKRRISSPAITFYDLAQVNIGTAESKIWADHPILKSPSYTLEATFPVPGVFGGAKYTIERFTNSDYQAYTDMLMEIPVENWKDFYRELRYDEMETVGYPKTLDFYDKNGDPPPFGIHSMDYSADISTPEGRASRDAYLADIGYAWTARGLEYRGLPKIEYFTIFPMREWFKASTDNSDYKVTNVYDPDADAVTDIAISGNIDVYLVPQIGLWMGARDVGTTVPLAFDGIRVMFAYQVTPRQHYPLFVDPQNLTDYYLRAEAFFDYQESRDGMIKSLWQAVGTFPTVITDVVESTFTSFSGYDYRSLIRGLPHSPLHGLTLSAAAGGATTYFDRTDPFLVAVVKIRGTFYYIWDVADADNETNAMGGYLVEVEGY